MLIVKRFVLSSVAVLALVSSGWAQECLTGTALLGDQRGLSAVRQSTDTACPCASFASRRSFRSCAQGIVDAALADATLRAECKKTAVRRYKAASCGRSTKETCGRFRETATDEPITCRVKGVARCKDRPRFEENVCSQDYCSDVIDWTAGTCIDPRAKGPYEVGVRVVPLTKMSVVHPDQQRTLNTVIWYPTTPGAGPINNTYDGVLNAPLDNSGGPYPLVLFSHGSCGAPTQSTFLTALLATQGFIVAAPPHPGNTLANFPACGLPGQQASSAQERPQDMIFVLDQMLAFNADSGSAFFGSIDGDKIAMSGHSFGGFTTYAVQSIEPRIKVAIPMAAATINSGLTVPSLTMLGQQDSVVNVPAIRDAYADSTSPKFLVEIANTGHYAFSGGCLPGSDCMNPNLMNEVDANAAVLRWVMPFLQVYLVGDPSYAPFLVGPPPAGFVLESAP